jgi:Apg6 BARA domain
VLSLSHETLLDHDRVEQALEADTERLQTECFTYQEAVRDDDARIKGWRQTIQRAAIFAPSGMMHEGEEVLSGVSNTAESTMDVERNTEEAFRKEVEQLEEACEQHREELAYLRALQREHALNELELDRLQDAIAEEQNVLELESRAFDNDQEQLSRALAEIQDEVERLSSSEIRLPATLLHLQVDIERGLRYPLINELRLAYRPKGDVQWKEIQAAWALAAHLLFIIGTLFQFQSQHWRIVPLSHCAKLIYYPPARSEEMSGFNAGQDASEGKSRTVVFNLGHPKTNGTKALLTWNALLCQVVHHVTSKIAQAVENGILDPAQIPPVPFAISPTNIGGISLTNLDENDDGGWSRVIHFMASDLLWLSECASSYVLQQVLLLTPVTGGATANLSE